MEQYLAYICLITLAVELVEWEGSHRAVQTTKRGGPDGNAYIETGYQQDVKRKDHKFIWQEIVQIGAAFDWMGRNNECFFASEIDRNVDT